MIPYMNVSRQYASISDRLDRAALEVLHSGAYILGGSVTGFEDKFARYCGVKHGIGVGNGTDALVIALKAAGIGPGDEVIVPGMSFVATSEAVVNAGGVPVFADTAPGTYTLDPAGIEARITDKTKAVIPVHIYGQCCDMDRILDIADAHGLIVIEDCAQAAGAVYKGRRAGSFGRLSCFSFFPTKNLGACGDGGIILTDDDEAASLCRSYRAHGRETKDKYYNYMTGYNSRLDALQAALLSVKLDCLNGWNERRREIAVIYAERITNPLITKPLCGEGSEHVYYAYVVAVKDRDRFRQHMEARGVSTGVYFPVPLHLQRVYAHLGYSHGDLPNAEYISEHTAVIPMFPELTEGELEAVIDGVNSFR